MSESYQLSKWIWTEADFDEMSWHDSQIHAVAFLPQQFEIAFDLDYILEWIHPSENQTAFNFWVAPATLVFDNVYDMQLDIESAMAGLEIDVLRRDDPRPPRNAKHIDRELEWLWTIECQEGEIRFRSAGFKLFIRDNPQYGQAQSLDLEWRALSFVRGRSETKSA